MTKQHWTIFQWKCSTGLQSSNDYRCYWVTGRMAGTTSWSQSSIDQHFVNRAALTTFQWQTGQHGRLFSYRAWRGSCRISTNIKMAGQHRIRAALNLFLRHSTGQYWTVISRIFNSQNVDKAHDSSSKRARRHRKTPGGNWAALGSTELNMADCRWMRAQEDGRTLFLGSAEGQMRSRVLRGQQLVTFARTGGWRVGGGCLTQPYVFIVYWARVEAPCFTYIYENYRPGAYRQTGAL